jgi:hypothetical protein
MKNCECSKTTAAKKRDNRDIEIYLTSQGKFVALVISNEEMVALGKKMECPAPNFLTITDVAGHVHVFNSAEILAITAPDTHNLRDETGGMEFALHLHEKGLVDDSELRAMVGLPPKKTPNKTVGLGNK